MRRSSLALALALALALTAAIANAQTSPSLETGLKSYGSYHGGNMDDVSLSNGNLTLHIPFLSYPQRGKLKLDFFIRDNNKNWAVNQKTTGSTGANQVNDTENWVWTGDSVSIATDDVWVFTPGVATNDNAIPPLDSVTDPMGSVHNLINVQQLDGTWTSSEESSDGSGIRANGTTIVDRDGIIHTAGTDIFGVLVQSYTSTDTNGNQISRSISLNSGQTIDGGWIDSIGRAIPGGQVFSYRPAYTPLTGSPVPRVSNWIPGIPISGIGSCPAGTATAYVWQPPLPPGQTGDYTFCMSTVALATAFNLKYTSIPSQPNGAYVAEASLSKPLLTAIVLPNGQQWLFSYDGYGDLQQVTLPTSGAISYQWSTLPSTNTGEPTGVSRWVTQRTLNANDGTGNKVWKYGYAINPSTSTLTTTVTDPFLNDTAHVFGFSTGNGSLFETEARSYQGSQSSGTLLKTVDTHYQDYGDTGAGDGAVVPDMITTTIPNGSGSLVSKVVRGYDTSTKSSRGVGNTNGVLGPISNVLGTFTYGSLLSETQYDFASGAPGAILRQTNSSYKWQAATSYQEAKLLDLNCLTTVYGAGSVPQQTSCAAPAIQANQEEQTAHGYDEAGSPQGAIGNPTSVTRWLNTGASVKSQTIYNGQGMPSKKCDPVDTACANPTVYTYDDTGLFPSSIQSPTAANGVKQVDYYVYDANTGSMTSHTDPNGAKTSYTYDSMNRLTDILYPDVYPGTSTHGETKYCYNDTASECGSGPANAVFVTQVMSPTQSKVQEVDVDGLGRKQHLKVTDPAGNDVTDFTYDALGRMQSVSNPYRTTSEPTYGITSYLYDALGRKTYQCQPDNAAAVSTTCVPTNDYQSWSYNGNVTTFTDENKNQWQRTTDALGRLTQVSEPNGSGASPTLTTAYGHDALDSLLSVKQSGLAGTDTPRSRSFAYDSLSRLVCASNPENSTASCPSGGTGAYTPGTTGYGYDANGNLTSKTDARGVTTTYSYDALNRLLGKTYTNAPAGTLSSCYQYDTAANGVGRLAAKWTQAGACPSAPPSNYQSLRSYGAYDAMGRALTERQCAAGYCTSASMPAQPAANCAALAGATGLQYCYDLAGDLLAYSNGLTTQAAGQFPQQALLFSQTFDAAARLNGVGSSWTNDPTHPQALFSSPTYTPFNALSSWLLGAQLTTSRSYDTRLRVTGQSSAQ